MTEKDNIDDVEEDFTFPEDGRRPTCDHPKDAQYKYMPLDKVFLRPLGQQTSEGPYLVERTEDGKYTLCDEAGRTVKNGKLYEESELVLYSHFG